jgi:cell division protease FtsH
MRINWKRSIIFYMVIIVAAIVLFTVILPSGQKPEEIPLSEAIAMSQSGEIEKIVVDGDTLSIKATDGTELVTFKEINASIYEIEGLNLAGVEVEIKGAGGIDWGAVFINILPFLFLGALIFFIFSQARGANSQAMSFGRSKARMFSGNTPTVTFDDVAGVEEAKQELREVVDFLRSREKFQALGARIPKGMLLIGPPGTGKTLMARAIAGEAGVPFFSISGSEFVEMFVGVGASRVRDLFDQAKRNAPCIIFIDEIDAVGRHRGAGLGGGHDEREQTLNQILNEMDGFSPHESVIVLAATNRPDVLDSALTRPGRFDRQITLNMPQKKARKKILEIHTRKVSLDKNVDLENLASRTVGFSGADLKNLVNEAALLAARENKDKVDSEDFIQARDKIILGHKREEMISDEEKKVIAYHEAGHALLAKITPGADPIEKVTIIPRGRSLGATEQVPEEDRHNLKRDYLLKRIRIMLGGRAAEQLTFKDISNGAANDLKQATKLARKMVTQWGMSERLGPVTFSLGEEHLFLGREMTKPKDFSEDTARIIDEEIQNIVSGEEENAKEQLKENKKKLKKLAETLIEKETLEKDEIDKILE